MGLLKKAAAIVGITLVGASFALPAFSGQALPDFSLQPQGVVIVVGEKGSSSDGISAGEIARRLDEKSYRNERVESIDVLDAEADLETFVTERTPYHKGEFYVPYTSELLRIAGKHVKKVLDHKKGDKYRTEVRPDSDDDLSVFHAREVAEDVWNAVILAGEASSSYFKDVDMRYCLVAEDGLEEGDSFIFLDNNYTLVRIDELDNSISMGSSIGSRELRSESQDYFYKKGLRDRFSLRLQELDGGSVIVARDDNGRIIGTMKTVKGESMLFRADDEDYAARMADVEKKSDDEKIYTVQLIGDVRQMEHGKTNFNDTAFKDEVYIDDGKLEMACLHREFSGSEADGPSELFKVWMDDSSAIIEERESSRLKLQKNKPVKVDGRNYQLDGIDAKEIDVKTSWTLRKYREGDIYTFPSRSEAVVTTDKYHDELPLSTKLRADNYILIGGPVANEMTAALVKEGKSEIDWYTSDGEIEVIGDCPEKDKHCIVVAGRDRESTKLAAELLADSL